MIGRPPPLSGGGVVGRVLKSQEPNWVLSSWSTGLVPPGPGVGEQVAERRVALRHVADDALDDAREHRGRARRRS